MTKQIIFLMAGLIISVAVGGLLTDSSIVNKHYGYQHNKNVAVAEPSSAKLDLSLTTPQNSEKICFKKYLLAKQLTAHLALNNKKSKLTLELTTVKTKFEENVLAQTKTIYALLAEQLIFYFFFNITDNG